MLSLSLKLKSPLAPGVFLLQLYICIPIFFFLEELLYVTFSSSWIGAKAFLYTFSSLSVDCEKHEQIQYSSTSFTQAI